MKKRDRRPRRATSESILSDVLSMVADEADLESQRVNRHLEAEADARRAREEAEKSARRLAAEDELERELIRRREAARRRASIVLELDALAAPEPDNAPPPDASLEIEPVRTERTSGRRRATPAAFASQSPRRSTTDYLKAVYAARSRNLVVAAFCLAVALVIGALGVKALEGHGREPTFAKAELAVADPLGGDLTEVGLRPVHRVDSPTPTSPVEGVEVSPESSVAEPEEAPTHHTHRPPAATTTPEPEPALPSLDGADDIFDRGAEDSARRNRSSR